MAVKIIQGGYKQFVVRLRDQSSDDPIDLTSATEITVCLKNADETDLELTLTDLEISLVSGPLGKFLVTVTSAQSALLKVLDNASMQVSYTLSGNTRRTIVERAYSVLEALC